MNEDKKGKEIVIYYVQMNLLSRVPTYITETKLQRMNLHLRILITDSEPYTRPDDKVNTFGVSSTLTSCRT